MATKTGIKPGVLYIVDNYDGSEPQYAITPDGEGLYWYDTFTEARDDLPDAGFVATRLTSKELDELRNGD